MIQKKKKNGAELTLIAGLHPNLAYFEEYLEWFPLIRHSIISVGVNFMDDNLKAKHEPMLARAFTIVVVPVV